MPQKYTVTTMAPTVEKIEISNIVFQNKLLGKSGDTISGSFLDGGNPGVKATVSLGEDAKYAIMDGITMKTVLTYEGGSEANGGYTINEDNSLKTVELGMPLIGNTYSSNSAENLLAGSYQVELKYSVGGEEKTHTFTDKLQVYSKKPDVTMALASGTPTTVTVNKDAGTAASTNIFIGTNTVINDGHSAVLYASYRPFTASENPGTYNSYTQNGYYASEFAHYEMPALTFTLTNGGSICKDFSLTVPNNGGASVALTNDAASAAVTIGSIEQGTEERDGNYTYEILGKPVSSDCKYSYKTERPNVIGEQTISDVTAIVNGEKYTFTLDDPMSIVQKNSTVPSLTFTVDDSRFVVPASQKSTDGRAFTLVLPGITTSAGAASVTADEVETTIATESTSGDPDVKAKNTAIADNLNWATASTNSQEKVYTVTEGTETGSHTRFGISGTYYYKVYTSMLYTRSNVTQTANLTVSVDGVTKNTKTEELYSVTTSLDYWLVDGTKYAPGQEVTISGNSVAVAVFAKDKTLKTKTVTTDETNGQTDYYYKTECSAIVTVSNGAGNTTTAKNDTDAYRCGHYTCSYTRGDANDALKYTGLVEPTNSGYTKVGSAEAGTVRDFTHSKWERNGEPVVKTGTTTTTVQVFDANGKLISSTTT